MKNNNNQKEKEKRSNVKNYIILFVIILLSIGIVLYISQLYKFNEEEKQKIPIIQGMLSEIYQEDLGHFVLDNPEAIVYICTANDEKCRTFERDFKKLLKKNDDYRNQIVYLNLTDVDQESFVDSFNSQYQYKKNLNSNYPAFVLFEDGKVKSIIQGKDNKTISILKLKQFLELNAIGE